MNKKVVKNKNHNKKIVARETSVSFKGPIPPPNILSCYEEISPGAAQEIIKMSHSQTNHRMEMEKLYLSSAVKDSKLGLWFAFIVAMTTILFSSYLILVDKVIGGTVLGSTSVLGSLTGVFIYGSRDKKSDK